MMTSLTKTLAMLAIIQLLCLGCDDQPISDAGDSSTPDGDADIDVDADIDGDADGDDMDADTDPDEIPENRPPVAAFEALPAAGAAPLDVTLDAGTSRDEDGEIVVFAWDFGDGAEADEGQVVSHLFETPGCFEVVLTVVDDRGGIDTARATIVVTDGLPEGDPVVAVEGLPLPMAVLPRVVELNAAAFTVGGTVSSPGYQAVTLAVVRGDEGSEEISTFTAPLCARGGSAPFTITGAIEAELISSNIEVRLVSELSEVVVASTEDVVAGDIYLVQGQSNAVARQFSGDANINQGPFLRSFGTRAENPAVSGADGSWHLAEGNAAEGPGAVGQWSLHMGRLLIEEQGVPIAIINGARGGRPITYFQRNDENSTDPATNYGRLLTRFQAAGLTGGVRAALYYQGESDGANAVEHHDGMVELINDWLEDYPSLERVYITQVRQGCGGPTPQLREGQRLLADELEMVSVMSTTGIDGHDGCHYPYENGYDLLGQRYAALLGRDLYDGEPLPDIEAPNPDRIVWSGDGGLEVTLSMRDEGSTLTWDAGAELNFVVEGTPVRVISGVAEGSELVLTLSGDASGATGISYLGHAGAGPWVRNANGIGLLAFYNVPIEAP